MTAGTPPLKRDTMRVGEEQIRHVLKLAHGYVQRTPLQQFVLAVFAGALISAGALLSLVFSMDVETTGAKRILLGFGFVAGFSMIIFSGAALFTEVNIALPLYLYRHRRSRTRVLRIVMIWVLVWVANVIGALIFGGMIEASDVIDQDRAAYLEDIMLNRLAQKSSSSFGGWMRVFASGMMANWLVGLAAYFAKAGVSLPAKLAGVLFPVIAFSSIGFQHAPANMGYFFMGLIHDQTSVTWGDAFGWNIIPASLGNLIGAAVLVCLPLAIGFNGSKVLNEPEPDNNDATKSQQMTLVGSVGVRNGTSVMENSAVSVDVV